MRFTLPALSLMACLALSLSACTNADEPAPNADDSGEKSSTSNQSDADQGADMEDPLPSLQAALDEKANNPNRDPDSPRAVAFREGIELVGESDAMENGLREGAQAPAFTLPNHRGEPINSADLLKQGPLVVVWYRGAWCPYCNIQLSHMAEAMPRIKKLGANVVAISPELPDQTVKKTDVDKLGFAVLSDLNNNVARKFKIVYTMPDVVNDLFLKGGLDLAKKNGTNNYDMPLAVTYVIDTTGEITYAYYDKDYKKRAEPMEIIDHLQTLKAAKKD